MSEGEPRVKMQTPCSLDGRELVYGRGLSKKANTRARDTRIRHLVKGPLLKGSDGGGYGKGQIIPLCIRRGARLLQLQIKAVLVPQSCSRSVWAATAPSVPAVWPMATKESGACESSDSRLAVSPTAVKPRGPTTQLAGAAEVGSNCGLGQCCDGGNYFVAVLRCYSHLSAAVAAHCRFVQTLNLDSRD